MYSRDNLEKLGNDLHEAGFDKISVKLPHNLVGIESQEVPLQEFIERERNYPAVIFSAVSTERRETVKILFVNISRKTFFVDDTFPSGHSEPSELFVQSPDPARVYSLAGFFGDYFKGRGKRSSSALKSLTYFAALFLLLGQILSLMKGRGFFSTVYASLPFGAALDLATSAIALFIVFTSFRTPTGLYVNPPPRSNLWTLANRAIKGEVMDNPLVSLIVTVIAGLVTALLLKLLGVL
jgi:hypothetical protein